MKYLRLFWYGRPDPGYKVGLYSGKMFFHWLRHRARSGTPVFALYFVYIAIVVSRQWQLHREYPDYEFTWASFWSLASMFVILVTLGTLTHKYWAQDQAWKRRELEAGYGLAPLTDYREN